MTCASARITVCITVRITVRARRFSPQCPAALPAVNEAAWVAIVDIDGKPLVDTHIRPPKLSRFRSEAAERYNWPRFVEWSGGVPLETVSAAPGWSSVKEAMNAALEAHGIKLLVGFAMYKVRAHS